MSPSAPPSPPASPPVTSRSARRRWAAGLLLLGAVLAGIGPFLPWVRAHYPAVADEPASTFYDMPGSTFAAYLRGLITAPNRFSISLTLLALLFFGAPLFFAALAARALLKRDWLPSRRIRRLGVALAVVGGVMTILAAYVLVNVVGSLDVVRAARTPLVGAAVALLGYLCMLIGASLLPARHS